jgi:hypothetical protein
VRETELLLANPGAIEAEAAYNLKNVEQILSDAWEHMGMSQKKQALQCLIAGLTVFRGKRSPDIDPEVTLVTPDAELPAPMMYPLVHNRLNE